MAEIADYSPVYPNEMANSTDSIDLDDPDYNGTDIESPTEDEGSRDEVLGGGMARGSSHQECSGMISLTDFISPRKRLTARMASCWMILTASFRNNRDSIVILVTLLRGHVSILCQCFAVCWVRRSI